MSFQILLDMDGVLCDMLTPWLKAYNKRFDDNLKNEDITDWNVHLFVKPECGLRVYDILKEDMFFQLPEPLPHAVEVCEWLHEGGYELVIVTAAPSRSKMGVYDKKEWVAEYLPFIPEKNFIATHRKEMVRGDLLFDDGPHNIEAFPGRTCVMDHPYNQEVEGDYRVSNWLEFQKLIETGF